MSLKPTKTLTKTITARAFATFAKPVIGEHFNDWCAHWAATARVVQAEFVAEGLVKTAETVDAALEFVARHTDEMLWPDYYSNTKYGPHRVVSQAELDAANG